MLTAHEWPVSVLAPFCCPGIQWRMNTKKVYCWLRLGHAWKVVAHNEEKVLECRRCREVKSPPGGGQAITPITAGPFG